MLGLHLLLKWQSLVDRGVGDPWVYSERLVTSRDVHGHGDKVRDDESGDDNVLRLQANVIGKVRGATGGGFFRGSSESRGGTARTGASRGRCPIGIVPQAVTADGLVIRRIDTFSWLPFDERPRADSTWARSGHTSLFLLPSLAASIIHAKRIRHAWGWGRR